MTHNVCGCKLKHRKDGVERPESRFGRINKALDEVRDTLMLKRSQHYLCKPNSVFSYLTKGLTLRLATADRILSAALSAL